MDDFSDQARMKLHDLARMSDLARIRSDGENADMERTYDGVMVILEPHIAPIEIRKIISTLCVYQRPCPSWFPCPHWCACGGFENPERLTYEETHPSPLLKWEPPSLQQKTKRKLNPAEADAGR